MTDKPIDNETQEMLVSFVSEAVDSLDTSEPLVENLKDPEDSESINAIFRVFHTLKGLSGFFGMKVINEVTHEAETLLDILRKENQPVSEDLITLIYSTFDILRDLLHLVSNNFSDEEGKDDAENMKLVLKDAITRIKSGNFGNNQEDDFSQFMVPPGASSNISEEDFNEDSFLDLSNENVVNSDAEQVNSDDFNFDVEDLTNNEETEQVPTEPKVDTSSLDLGNLISDEMVQQYLSDSKDLLDNAENNLLLLEKQPDDFDIIASIFGGIHSIKGNSGFMGFTEIEEIAMETETILDYIRKKELEPEPNIISILLSNIETMRNRIENVGKTSASENVSSNNISSNSNTVKEPAPTENKIIEKAVETSPKKDFEKNISEKSSEKISEVTKKVDSPIRTETKKIDESKSKSDSQSANSTNISKSFQQQQKQDIRVETTKIDKLFDLVGELITIETMVTNNPDLKGLQLSNFSKAANQLNKITRELQEVTMSVRMMPLEGQFNKMKRLVRDVSLKLGKKVDFSISGQETEMDKNVIDEIADPLVHILRNSLDHGVEFPEERLQKGKSETGVVSLSARYEGNEILITVKDDGAGIDKEKLLKKADEKGILTIPPDKMSDKEIFALIFEPGLSTAKQVTDISGRGVGMDVVRKNLEKLRGAIDVDSKLGAGTTVTLRIPLTLAIMEALLLKVGEETYALPILNVSETFRINREDISRTMDGLEMIKVRDEVLPVFRIHELFKRKTKIYNLEQGIIMIVESRSKKFCLFADELIGQQQAVIKGLSDYIGKVPGITGCMILGDGSIGLILDIEGTLLMAENPQHFNNPNLVLA